MTVFVVVVLVGFPTVLVAGRSSNFGKMLIWAGSAITHATILQNGKKPCTDALSDNERVKTRETYLSKDKQGPC